MLQMLKMLLFPSVMANSAARVGVLKQKGPREQDCSRGPFPLHPMLYVFPIR